MSFLPGMVQRRRDRIAAEFGAYGAADRERLACRAAPPRDFRGALTAGAAVAVIAEVKKASPSAGPIAPDCEASEQAVRYQDGGAAAISVLTEPESFAGSWTDLSDVAGAVDLPVLCKDFVVEPVQLYAARGYGADAVLLMVSVLGERTGAFIDEARTLGLEPLVEVVDAIELDLALRAGAELVGVNARDMRTLEVDPAAAAEIVREAASCGVTVVAASGVRDRRDIVRTAAAGADAVLVGETLMRSPFPEEVLAELTGVAKAPARTGGSRAAAR